MPRETQRSPEVDPRGPAAADGDSTTQACPECGHRLYDGWELIQHHHGRHHYRSWTPADGTRLAEERRNGSMRSLATIVAHLMPAESPPEPEPLFVFGDSVEGRYLQSVETER